MPGRGWRTGALLGEGMRNAFAGGTRTYSTMTAAALLLTGIMLLEARSIESAQRAETELLAAGRTTVVVAPQLNVPRNYLDADRCRALDAVAGIRAAGPVWGPVTIASAMPPRGILTVREGTAASFSAVTGESVRGVISAVAGDQLAEELALAPGSEMEVRWPTRSRRVEISEIRKLDRRDSTMATTLFVLTARGDPPDECWIEYQPWADSALLASSVAFFDAPLGTLRSLLVLPPQSLLVDPAELLRTRLSQHGWIAAALVLGALQYVAVRARRAELALYRSYRSGRIGSLLIIGSELFIVLSLASISALVIAGGTLLVAATSAAAHIYALGQLVKATSAVMLLDLVIAASGWWAPLAVQIKE